MTEQGVMPKTAHCGGSANDQQSLLKHAAGVESDEGIVKKEVCLVLIYKIINSISIFLQYAESPSACACMCFKMNLFSVRFNKQFTFILIHGYCESNSNPQIKLKFSRSSDLN